MTSELTISVEKDHLERLTDVSGSTALIELIWNSLDADATKIDIYYKHESALDRYEKITIEDNGHAISYNDAKAVFGKLGGSIKKAKRFSPANRLYHGKEGQGRFRAFALGDLIEYDVFYFDKSHNKGENFKINLDRNNINKARVEDVLASKNGTKPGVKIEIQNINQEKAKKALSDKSIEDIQQKLAVYYISYPLFSINVQGRLLDFSSAIKNKTEHEIIRITDTNEEIPFKIHIIEWNKQPDENKTLYFCGANGMVLHQTDLNIRKVNIPVTTYILSPYIQELYDKNQLHLEEMPPFLGEIIQDAKKLTKDYVRAQIAAGARNIIEELKQQKIYPYTVEPITSVEKVERDVFDIVTHQLHEYLPSFQTQETQGKKLMLTLVKEALEKDTGAFKKIMTEVLNLPTKKQEELMEIIEKTSLENVIDTMREVQDRLTTIHELRIMLYDKEEAKKYKERTQFHKIIIRETWLFGDDYTYGADDVTLKNVLKAYLQHLKRDDFEETITEGDNSEMGKIPDICLWKQYSLGEIGHFKNLVIELKKPIKKLTQTEVAQIKTYARRVANDERFPKDKTKWVFFLLGAEMDEDVKFDMRQEGREFGNIHVQDNISVWVMTWGNILSIAEARLQYLKEKLNYKVSEDTESISFLKNKYKEIFEA
jgi:hypothetical protein